MTAPTIEKNNVKAVKLSQSAVKLDYFLAIDKLIIFFPSQFSDDWRDPAADLPCGERQPSGS